MKKNKLVVDYEYNFDLLGIISDAREYKIAWLINKILEIKLVKEKDLKIEFLGNQNIIISNYLFKTEHSIFRLLKNKSYGGGSGSPLFLLPELKDFDYLVIMEGFEDTFNIFEVVKRLRSINEVQYLQKVSISDLKFKENLIF